MNCSSVSPVASERTVHLLTEDTVGRPDSENKQKRV